MDAINGKVEITVKDFEVLKSKALAFEIFVIKEYGIHSDILIPVIYNEWAEMSGFNRQIIVLTKDEIIIKMGEFQSKLQIENNKLLSENIELKLKAKIKNRLCWF